VARVDDDVVVISDSTGNLKLDECINGMTMDPTDGVAVSLSDISWIARSKYEKPTQHGGNMATSEIIEAIKAQADALIPAIVDEKKVEFDKGFDEGVAQGTVPGDKIYSQEEMDAELKPRDAKIVELGEQAVALQAALDGAKAELALAGPAAVAAFKVELKAKYVEQQVVESATETGFADLLA
jgi:hypothetical protein